MEPPPHATLCVQGIKDGVRRDALESVFEGYGRLVRVDIVPGNARRGLPDSRIAFVEFERRNDARKAMHSLNGRHVQGKCVMIQFARGRPGLAQGPIRSVRGGAPEPIPQCAALVAKRAMQSPSPSPYRGSTRSKGRSLSRSRSREQARKMTVRSQSRSSRPRTRSRSRDRPRSPDRGRTVNTRASADARTRQRSRPRSADRLRTRSTSRWRPSPSPSQASRRRSPRRSQRSGR